MYGNIVCSSTLLSFRTPNLFINVSDGGGIENTRLEAKAKDSSLEDRPPHGKRQECSRPRQEPRTQAQVFSKKRSTKFFFKKKVIFQTISKRRKKGSSKIFLGDFQKRKTKKVFAKFSARFLAFSNKILTVQKIVLFSSRGQGNFRGLEASRPRPRT